LNTPILAINNISKRYGSIQALDNVTITIDQGSVFGILGPNGSGKTTLLGILLGVTNANTGHFSWFDNASKDENRQRIGSLLETPNYYSYLNAVQNLKIVSEIKRINDPTESIERVLKTVNLYERRHSKFKTYSLGMKQRLAIAAALLCDPDVLVLDEPTNGLDPQGIAEIRSLITEIANRGKTIIVASHQLDEVEKICTHVAIIKNGKLIHQGDINNIINNPTQVIVKAKNNEKIKTLIQKMNGVEFVSEKNGLITLAAKEEITTEDINRYFFEAGVVLSELKEIRKNLETQFLEITNQ